MTELVQSPALVKSCCAWLYESDWARLLLGDSFHPGGLVLTERLGTLLGLRPGWRVLDVAAGRGTSALFLAERFGCEVVGVDYGAKLVAFATEQAQKAGLADRVSFTQGDAERLDLPNGAFEAIVCECAFCTFPDKQAAVSEFARVLRPAGRVGLSDLTQVGPLPPELDTLLAWLACLADAQPLDRYLDLLTGANFLIDRVEPHNEALSAVVKEIGARLLGAELLLKLNKLDIPGADFGQARNLARHAAKAVRQGNLGYALLVATKTSGD